MIVLDASTIVSAALVPGSLPERALLHAREHDTVALSDETYAELAGVLARPRLTARVDATRVAEILDALRDGAAWFIPVLRVNECRDPKDDKYLELAAACDASAVVTGDLDLLVLNPWRGIRILRPADYLAEAGRKPSRPATG